MPGGVVLLVAGGAGRGRRLGLEAHRRAVWHSTHATFDVLRVREGDLARSRGDSSGTAHRTVTACAGSQLGRLMAGRAVAACGRW